MSLTIAERRALERGIQQQEWQRICRSQRESFALIAALEPRIHTQPATKPARIRHVAVSDTQGDPIREWKIPQRRKWPPFWKKRVRAQAERTNQVFRAACNNPQAERVSRNRFLRAILSACRVFLREWAR
jgi:hypothetical protein